MKKDKTNQQRRALYDAIRAIALHGLVNPKTGAVHNTERVTGYVAAIHTDGKLAGTIDVQEYLNLSDDEEEDVDVGYHEGVMLSSVQDNSNGMVIVPKLYSEVTIATDPVTLNEYVVMYSHVDIIQLDSHEKVVVGVREREEYDIDDDEAPDVEDLPLTGVSATTTYLKDSITTTVSDEENEKQASQVVSSTEISSTVGEESSVVLDEDEVRLKHGDSETVLSDDSNTMKHGSSEVVVEDGMVSVGSTNNTDVAVLGNELGQILTTLFNCISQITTSTALGPQPPMNIPAFLSLKGQIERFKSRHVKIQK